MGTKAEHPLFQKAMGFLIKRYQTTAVIWPSLIRPSTLYDITLILVLLTKRDIVPQKCNFSCQQLNPSLQFA